MGDRKEYNPDGAVSTVQPSGRLSRVGKPSKLNADVIQRVAKWISQGVSEARALAACGIGSHAAADWRRRVRAGHGGIYLEYVQATEAARAELASRAIQRVQEAADEDPKNWRAWAWLAERADPVSNKPAIDATGEDGEDDGAAVPVGGPDVIDAEEIGTDGDVMALLEARVARARRQLAIAEASGSAAPIAALERSLRSAENELLAHRKEVGDGLSHGLVDPAALPEERLLVELRSASATMPEDHLRIFAEEWLRRHRLVAVPDPSVVSKLGAPSAGGEGEA